MGRVKGGMWVWSIEDVDMLVCEYVGMWVWGAWICWYVGMRICGYVVNVKSE